MWLKECCNSCRLLYVILFLSAFVSTRLTYQEEPRQHALHVKAEDRATELSSAALVLNSDKDTLYETDSFVESEDGEVVGQGKRSAPVERPPILREMFANHVPNVNEKKKLLALSQVPLMLDLSPGSQNMSMARAFSLKLANKRYQLNALDDWNNTPEQILMADERTFRQAQRAAFFTLKRLHAIELDNCARLCYDIEEWNFNSSSKQICHSFSHCNFERQCVLVIDTDIGFVDSLLDLVEEGDIVAQIESPERSLLKDEPGCNVYKRSSMATFEGPISLPAGIFGHSSTETIFDDEQRNEWLPFASSSVSSSLDADLMERCAQACLNQNTLSSRICLAMDYCETKHSKTQSSGTKLSQFQQQCLLFVTNPVGAADVTRIKSKLSNLSSMPRPVSVDDSGSEQPATCQRFLTSYLLEYNNLRQRSISPRLIANPTTIRNSDIEQCAVECSLRQTGDCLLFEHCSRYNVTLRMVKTECTIFDDSTIRASQQNETGKFPSTKEESASQQLRAASSSSTTVFSKDCHVYLRREFKSIDAALDSLAKLADSKANGGRIVVSPEKVDHSALIIGFILIFSPIFVAFVLIVRRILSVPAISAPAAAANADAGSGGLAQEVATELSDFQPAPMINRQNRWS